MKQRNKNKNIPFHFILQHRKRTFANRYNYHVPLRKLKMNSIPENESLTVEFKSSFNIEVIETLVAGDRSTISKRSKK